MHKILTIDFDFIMEPCINLYNHLINGAGCISHKQIWDNVYEELTCENFISYNEDNYKFIISLLENINCPIYIGPDHTSILRAIDDEYKKNPQFCGPFEIVNIDHHHDIVYTDFQMTEIQKYSYPGCADWVGYLFYNNFISKYYWIANENSKINLTVNFPKAKLNTVILNKENFHTDYQFDMCYISSSIEWIPPQILEKYFSFLRKIINKWGDNIQWYSSDYDNYERDQLLTDGVRLIEKFETYNEEK